MIIVCDAGGATVVGAILPRRVSTFSAPCSLLMVEALTVVTLTGLRNIRDHINIAAANERVGGEQRPVSRHRLHQNELS